MDMNEYSARKDELLEAEQEAWKNSGLYDIDIVGLELDALDREFYGVRELKEPSRFDNVIRKVGKAALGLSALVGLALTGAAKDMAGTSLDADIQYSVDGRAEPAYLEDRGTDFVCDPITGTMGIKNWEVHYDNPYAESELPQSEDVDDLYPHHLSYKTSYYEDGELSDEKSFTFLHSSGQQINNTTVWKLYPSNDLADVEDWISKKLAESTDKERMIKIVEGRGKYSSNNSSDPITLEPGKCLANEDTSDDRKQYSPFGPSRGNYFNFYARGDDPFYPIETAQLALECDPADYSFVENGEMISGYNLAVVNASFDVVFKPERLWSSERFPIYEIALLSEKDVIHTDKFMYLGIKAGTNYTWGDDFFGFGNEVTLDNIVITPLDYNQDFSKDTIINGSLEEMIVYFVNEASEAVADTEDLGDLELRLYRFQDEGEYSADFRSRSIQDIRSQPLMIDVTTTLKDGSETDRLGCIMPSQIVKSQSDFFDVLKQNAPYIAAGAGLVGLGIYSRRHRESSEEQSDKGTFNKEE